jgi:hypothetical protein
MRSIELGFRILAWIASLSFCTVLSAQKPNCSEIHAMARMTTAKSASALSAWHRKAGDSYRAKVVYSFRLFELHPTDPRAASSILDLIPQSEKQGLEWYSFSDYLDCKSATDDDAESWAEVRMLAGLGGRLPRDLARAVLLVPSKMLAYVSYANASSQFPDSDYAMRMRAVCRARHREFVKAIDELYPDAKSWLLASTFNPEGCKALHFPER